MPSSEAPRQIGPRMQLEVVKVEEGLCAGRVLFHSLIARSATETAAQQAQVEERQRLKAERRRQQATPLWAGCERSWEGRSVLRSCPPELPS